MIKVQEHTQPITSSLSIDIEPDWFSYASINRILLYQFTILQIATMSRNYKYRKIALQHPKWDSSFVTDSSPAPNLETLKVETSLPAILDFFYGEKSKFYQTSISDDWLNKKKTLFFLKVKIYLFYSFSDVIALFGRRLGQLIAEILILQKRVQSKNSWINLPLLIQNLDFDLTFQVQVMIHDNFGIEYSSLSETCRAYNIELSNKFLMNEYQKYIRIAYKMPGIQENFIRYTIVDLL